jgi:hypothetical protein
MSPAHRSPLSHFLLAGALIAVFLFQSITASLEKSPIIDEPAHISSGLSYWATRVFIANPEHPPLLKEISALSLMLAGVRWPKSDLAEALTSGQAEGKNLEWPLGNNILHDYGVDRVLFWGRLPLALLGGLLGWLIFWWGRELVGSPAALAALFFFAFDPTMVAHASLVTTDVGVTTFTVLFLFALWRYIERPGWGRLVPCGLALGAVLCTKFNAVFLLPIIPILLAVAIRWPIAPDTAPAPPIEKKAVKAAPNALCPCGSGKRYKNCHGAVIVAEPNLVPSKFKKAAIAFAAMCGMAVVVIEALYFFPGDPFLYVTGLTRVNANHDPSNLHYLHGQMAATHYLSYFVATYLLKEPLATVILSTAGLVILFRGRYSTLVKWFLLLTPLVFLVATTLFADDIGFRYIIPTLPFAYILAGLGLVILFRQPDWGRYAAAALCVWVIVAAIGIYPDHLSYFNESACLLESPGKIGWDGGSSCGIFWLDDSNIDWGQGLKELRQWQVQHAPTQPVRLMYFGTYPPQGYQLNHKRIEPDDLMPDPSPGLYAVSADVVARDPVLGAARIPVGAAWLRTMKPIAIVHHAYYIYDVH